MTDGCIMKMIKKVSHKPDCDVYSVRVLPQWISVEGKIFAASEFTVEVPKALDRHTAVKVKVFWNDYELPHSDFHIDVYLSMFGWLALGLSMRSEFSQEELDRLDNINRD